MGGKSDDFYSVSFDPLFLKALNSRRRDSMSKSSVATDVKNDTLPNGNPFKHNSNWGKVHDYTSGGVKTPFFSSRDSRVRTENESGVEARSQAISQRSHEESLFYRSGRIYQEENNKNREYGLNKTKIKSHSNVLSSFSSSFANFLSTKVQAESSERMHNAKLSAADKKDKRKLRVADKMDKRKHRSSFLAHLFNGASERRRYKAHKRSIKQSAKEQRRTIAMQRGYW